MGYCRKGSLWHIVGGQRARNDLDSLQKSFFKNLKMGTSKLAFKNYLELEMHNV